MYTDLALFIDGAFLSGDGRDGEPVLNPATGQALARARFGEASVFYFPLDFEFAIRPYLRLLHPALVVIAETEFWPNFLRLARENGAKLAVVNARISDRSWPGYRRFRAILSRASPEEAL